MAGPVYMLRGTTLLRARWHMLDQIHLATAAWKRSGHRWDIKWKAGRVGKGMSIRVSPAFSEALEQAIHQARESDTESPSAQESFHLADPALSVKRQALWIGVAVLVFAITLWTAHPWWLILLGPLVPLMARERVDRRLLLAGDGLWVVELGKEPHRIALELITEVSTPKGKPAQILTGDQDYPALPVRTSTDLVKHLRRRLAGEPPEAAATPAGPPPGPKVLRCTLCGRPVSELAPDASPDPKAI